MTNERVSQLKVFIGAKDWELSRDFYKALGFTVNFDHGSVAEFQVGDNEFLLQRFYQKDWCENTMLQVHVEDAQLWYDKVTALLKTRDYGDAKVSAPKDMDYGATVTFMWDPSGVLWHLAQFK